MLQNVSVKKRMLIGALLHSANSCIAICDAPQVPSCTSQGIADALGVAHALASTRTNRRLDAEKKL